jgi:hypothetical protein
MNATIVDVLIQNIKTDQQLLDQTEVDIENAKEEKRKVVDRIKDHRKDLLVMVKYADETQRRKIEELGFDLSESERGLNHVASIALDIILKTKGNQMSNGDLYEAYAKSCKAKKVEPENYTQFNIKCRTLFNTQRLLRKKGKDTKNTREDIISLNGHVLESGDVDKLKKTVKKKN